MEFVTVCSVETTHGSTCIAMWHVEDVHYRALVAIMPLMTEATWSQSILHRYYKFIMEPEDCASSHLTHHLGWGLGKLATSQQINLHKGLGRGYVSK